MEKTMQPRAFNARGANRWLGFAIAGILALAVIFAISRGRRADETRMDTTTGQGVNAARPGAEPGEPHYPMPMEHVAPRDGDRTRPMTPPPAP